MDGHDKGEKKEIRMRRKRRKKKEEEVEEDENIMSFLACYPPELSAGLHPVAS